LHYLFWRTQIVLLRKCPPLYGVVCNFGLNAANSKRLWLKALFWLALHTPAALLRHLRNKLRGRVVLSRVTLPITTRCTLNCTKCIARTPHLQSHADIPLHTLTQDIASLFACVDEVYALVISGGEALLHPQLAEVLRLCASYGKAGQISLQTNGTVMPSSEVLAALKDTNTTVKISRYPAALQPNVEQLKALLAEHGIVHLHDNGTHWLDFGLFGQPQPGNVKKRFRVCVQQISAPLYHGKYHLCCESAILMDQSRIADFPQDYIDLRSIAPHEFAAQWKNLQKRRCLSACTHCQGHTYLSPKIPMAKQEDHA